MYSKFGDIGYASPQIIQFFNELKTLNIDHHTELTALCVFLARHRHGATLPEVRWRIQQSNHYPTMGEVRATEPFPPYRILFAMPENEAWLVFLAAGNKATGNHQNNDWYDAWVPVADAFLTHFLKNFPNPPQNGKL